MIAYVVAVVTIIASMLNVFNKRSCFVIWCFTNTYWIINNARIGEWPQAMIFVAYLITCVIGLIHWGKNKKGKAGSTKMKLIKASAQIISPVDREAILSHLETVGRTCYQSEPKGDPGKFVKGLIKRGHEAIIEHYSLSVRFIVDRGVSHELVRHRIASFAQESTRYCNYGHDEECSFIYPFWMDESTDNEWKWACGSAERAYLDMLAKGASPQEARSVLPNSLKTEIIMTANLREWRHFFKLRALGLTGKPHPQMLEVALPLFREMKALLPEIFFDMEEPTDG